MQPVQTAHETVRNTRALRDALTMSEEDQRNAVELWETTQETLRKDLGGATTRLQAVQDTLEKALTGTCAQKTLVRVC